MSLVNISQCSSMVFQHSGILCLKYLYFFDVPSPTFDVDPNHAHTAKPYVEARNRTVTTTAVNNDS